MACASSILFLLFACVCARACARARSVRQFIVRNALDMPDFFYVAALRGRDAFCSFPRRWVNGHSVSASRAAAACLNSEPLAS